MTQRLDTELFKSVVANTPLISVDLIVRNPQGQILLGQRVNRPAQGYWFVPGGRVRKDELLANAFTRLVNEELGLISCNMQNALFLGPFEHFYADNFSGDDFSTHYVVLGYQLDIDALPAQLPHEQHHSYRWFSVDELLNSSYVHFHTKQYFQNNK